MVSKALAAALALVSATVASAYAGEEDPEDDSVLMNAPEITMPIRENSGWYVRGDVGYDFHMDAGDPAYRTYDSASGRYAADTFNNARFDNNVSGGAGLGYQFNDTVRADLTLDYFRTRLNGDAFKDQVCTPSAATGQGACSFNSQRMSAVSGFANAYADLGTFLGVTPYIGAGAGLSHVAWAGVKYDTSCLGGSGCAGVDYGQSRSGGASDWRFSYAAMLGFSYDLTDRLKLDVGYRYVRTAGGRMANFSSFDKAQGAEGARMRDKGFSRHEVRVGLRLMGW